MDSRYFTGHFWCTGVLPISHLIFFIELSNFSSNQHVLCAT